MARGAAVATESKSSESEAGCDGAVVAAAARAGRGVCGREYTATDTNAATPTAAAGASCIATTAAAGAAAAAATAARGDGSLHPGPGEQLVEEGAVTV